MSYVTLEDFKGYVKATRSDPGDEAILQAVLNAASDAVDDYCQRTFTVAGLASDRSYSPDGWDVVRIHDCTSIVSILANGTTVATSSWQGEPTTVSWTGEVRPIEQIRYLRGWWMVLIPGKPTVTVTATWGWAATPGRVVEATKILAKDILANRDVTFGIAAFTAYAGVRARENPQVAMLLDRYRRVEAFGIG